MSEPSGPIFIGGTGRSGTTLLSGVLGQHPEIFSFRWESQFIVAPFGIAECLDSPKPARALKQFETLFWNHWYKRTIRPGTSTAYQAGLCDILSEERAAGFVTSWLAQMRGSATRSERVEASRRFIEEIFDPARRSAGARVWCEKTPRNILLVHRLLELFPDMRFIHVVRDVRDVAASLLARKFKPVAASEMFPETRGISVPMTAAEAARYWSIVIQAGRDRLRDLPRDQWLEVRLEDLTLDEDAALSTICTFLGIGPFGAAPDATDRRRNVRIRPDRAHIGRWRVDFTESEIQEIEAEAGECMRLYGYQPSGPP